MISVVHANNILAKQYNEDGTKTSGAHLSNFDIKGYKADTPQELEQLFIKLAPNELIISGITNNGEHTKLPTAKREHFSQGTWFPFDRDYLINDRPTIELLQALDPQFKYISYLRKSSASNISINDKLQAPYREKVWVQFLPGTTHEQVKSYVTKLFHKAFLLDLAHIALSPEPTSPAITYPCVFDRSCFRPEALHYESVPVINNPTVKHNTYYFPHTGDATYIDTNKLQFSQLDETQYLRKLAQLKADFAPLKAKRLKEVKELRPSQDWTSLDKGFISDDTELHTIDNETFSVGKILTQLMQGNDITSYLDKEYTDPLDPDYHDGTQKAKLYLNEDDTLILHSFAHGSHHYRAAADITLLPSVLVHLDCVVSSKGTMDLTDKVHTFNTIKRIAPYFYIQSSLDLDFVGQTLKQVATAAQIVKILRTLAYNPTATLPMEDHPLREYVFFKEGGGKVLMLDPEEGLVVMSVSGIKEFLQGKHPDFTGSELYEQWITYPKRKDVISFGLYDHDKYQRLSMWAGFSAPELGKKVTEHDILPFLTHIKLATKEDPEALKYFLNWMADLVQNPLRTGTRPAIVLQSEEQGTGKSTLFKLLSSFFNPFNVFTSSKLDSIIGKHNKHLMSTVLFGLDEVVSSKDSGPKQVADALKNIISEDTVAVEPKGIDVKQVPNKIRLLITTNKPFIYTESHGRRFTVFYFSSEHKEDIPYFKNLISWWEDEGRDLTFTYLKQLKVDSDMAQKNFRGQDTIDASTHNIFGLQGRDLWLFGFVANLQQEINKIDSKGLYDSYISFTSTTTGVPNPANQIAISKYIKSYDNTPAVEFKSNSFIIRKSVLMEKFALRVLGTSDFDWSSYVEVKEEELNLTKEVEL